MRPTLRKAWTLWLALAAITLIVGCGGGGAKIEMGTVTGTVTLDGSPVKAGTVSFIPDADQRGNGPMSTASIDENGKYDLVGPGGRKGAVLGHHKVTVGCPPPNTNANTPPPPCVIPLKYADEIKTDLRAEVKSGKNTVDLQLKSGRK